MTISGLASIDTFNGVFSKILTFFSVPTTAHLAWMQLSVNFGIFIIHASYLLAFILSFKSLKNSPREVDKMVFGISLVLVSIVLLAWFIDGSYPVLYNTWELIKH